MSYKLKFVGSEFYPDYFVIPTYAEIVEVKNGFAEVELEVTKDRLLKEGFILVNDQELNKEEKKAVIDIEAKKVIKKKVSKENIEK